MPTPEVRTVVDYIRSGQKPDLRKAGAVPPPAPLPQPPASNPVEPEPTASSELPISDRPQAPIPGPVKAAPPPLAPPTAPGRPWLYFWIAVGALFAALLPLDGRLSGALRSLHLSGDLRREVESLQQFGQAVSAILILITIWLVDPSNRRRLADLVAGYGLAALLVILGKGLIGRPRPKFDDPLYFLGPLGQYPIDTLRNGHPVGVRHAWELGSGISSDLWSMPSSHTAYAAATALFVASLYPKLRTLMLALAAFVALARVLTGAHYPTDVLIGGAIGVFAAQLALDHRWGQRLLARFPPVAGE